MPHVAGGKGGKASAGDSLFAFSCGGRGLRLRHPGWVPAAARRSTPPRQELHLPAGCGRRAWPEGPAGTVPRSGRTGVRPRQRARRGVRGPGSGRVR